MAGYRSIMSSLNVSRTASISVAIYVTTGPSTMRPHSRFAIFDRERKFADPT